MVRTTSMKIFRSETISGWGELNFHVVNLIEKMKICKIIFRFHRFFSAILLFSLWDENYYNWKFHISKCSKSSIRRRHHRKISGKSKRKFSCTWKIIFYSRFCGLCRQRKNSQNSLALCLKIPLKYFTLNFLLTRSDSIGFIKFHSIDTNIFSNFFPESSIFVVDSDWLKCVV